MCHLTDFERCDDDDDDVVDDDDRWNNNWSVLSYYLSINRSKVNISYTFVNLKRSE